MNDTPATSISEEQSAAIYGGATSPTQPADPAPDNVAAGEEPVPEPTPAEIDSRLAEAEQRGYLRGRNEAAAEMMNRPTMWQPIDPTGPAGRITAATDAFLSGLKPGVWDD